MTRYIPIVICVAALMGCRQIQLRNHTAVQARTVSDMHTQQVMDNLAMFVYDPGSFPSFSTFDQGAAQVSDMGGLATPTQIGRFTAAEILGLTTFGIEPRLERTAFESWTIKPVNDPRKLELMRCAYQRAVAGIHPEADCCPDCRRLFNKFYTGNPETEIADKVKSGHTTTDCLAGDSYWFETGCKKCVPRNCECLYVGSYCGRYVWVRPEGRNELSKLTLAILDFAVNDPAKEEKPTKEVIFEYGADNKLIKKVVAATINQEDPPESILIDSNTKGQQSALLGYLKTLGIDKAAPQLVTSEDLATLTPEKLAELSRYLTDNHLHPSPSAVKSFQPTIGTFSTEAVKTLAPTTKQRLQESILLDLNRSEINSPSPIFIPSRPSQDPSQGALESLQNLRAITPPRSRLSN